MTKREICERLFDIYEFLKRWGTGLSLNDPFEYAQSANAEEFLVKARKVRSLIIDLAAPDDHFADAGKKGATLPDISVAAPEEEKPPVLIYEENGEKVPCPVCGEPAAPIKNKPGVFSASGAQAVRAVPAEEG